MAINFLNIGAFPDDVKLTFGGATDYEIYHNSTTNVNHISSLLDRQLSVNANIIQLTNQANSTTYLKLESSEATFTTDVRLPASGKLYTWTGSNDNYLTYNSWYIWTSLDTIIRNSGTGPFKFQTNGANDVLTLDSSQNATFAGTVGINIAAPTSTYQLRVDGHTLISAEKYYYVAGGGAGIGSDASGNLILRQNSANLMTTSGSDVTFAGDITVTGGDITIGTDAIAGNINSVGDVLALNVDSNTGGGAGANIQLKTAGTAQLTVTSSSATFAGDILTNTDSSSDIGKTATRWANIWVDNINGAAPRTGDYLPLAGGTMTGDVIFNDSVKALFGTGSDLKVYHDGSAALIDNYTGSLSFREFAANEDIIFFADNGSGGGNITEYFRVDGSLADGTYTYTTWVDNGILGLGTGSDLQLYHTGTDSYISNKTGDLYIKTRDDDKDVIIQSDDGSGGTTTYMLFDGSQTNIHTQVDFRIYDSKKLQLGNSADGEFYSDGSDLYMTNTTGDMYLINKADDKDIIFQSDDGSGGYTTYFQLDGGEGRTVFKQNAIWEDNKAIYMGNAADLRLYHNATDSHIDNYAGNLNIVNNTDDGDINLYSDDGSGGVTPYLTLDGSAGYTTAQKDIRFDDGIAAAFGTGIDAFIKHSGSEFNIYNDIGAMNFIQRQNDGNMVFQSDDGSGGTATYFSLDGGSSATNELYTKWPDYSRIALGSGKDLQIYHDGNHSWISDQGTGNLNILTTSLNVNNAADTQNMIVATQGSSVNLYYNGTQHFRTISSGAEITGALSITGDGSNAATLTESGSGDFTIAAADDIRLDAGGNDIVLRGASSAEFGRLSNNSQDFIIKNITENKDIVFQGNDGNGGSGVNIDALKLDMSGAGYAYFNSGISATNTSFSGTMNIAGSIYHIGDADTYFGFPGNDTFTVTTGGTTALTIDSSQDATFTGDVSAVTLTLSGKGTSAATVDGDGSTTMATKGWVESKLTGATLYQGTWDPDVSLNSGYGNPDLSTAALQVNGYYYICSADGIAEPNGTGTEPDTWHTGDWVIWNDDVGVSGEWQKIDNTTVLSGAGTGEYLARWTDTETLGDSVVLTSGEDILIPRYIAHVGDTNTYFGFSGNDTIQFNTNGSERMRIISSGEVGIGTSTPQTTLQVDGVISVKTGDAYRMYNAAGTGWGEMNFNEVNNRVEFNRGINNSGADWLLSENSVDSYVCANEGAFGIGTTSPGNKLHIVSGDEDTLRLVATSGQPAIFWYPDGSVKWEERASASTWQLYSYDESEWIFNLYNGKCGIGITNPSFKLDVYQAADSTVRFGSDDNSTVIINSNANDSATKEASIINFQDGGATKWSIYKETSQDLYVYNPVQGKYPLHFKTGGDVVMMEDGNKLTIGSNASSATSRLIVNQEGGVEDGFTLQARTNRARLKVADNDTTGYITAEAGIFGFGRTASVSANNINVDASHNVGIRTITPAANLDVQGGIIAGGKTMYTISSASLTTTGTAVAGLSTGTNLQSSGFIFTCFGGDGYQRIVYSCKNVSGTWDIDKDIDEGVNAFDVTYAADGSDNITFTFKSRSGTQSYAPKVTVEAMGDQIQTSYIN